MAAGIIPNKPGNVRIRSPRFLPDKELFVKSKTIGTSLCYRLKADDISLTGLLLSWEFDSHVPFIKNTLIEMEIDSDCIWLEEPISCIGRVVRRMNEAGTKFGIVIVQMDGEAIHEWDNCVKALEERRKNADFSCEAA
ncbi:MAG: hypothetical protein R3B45_04955 [Bdellovibrionota bacterium]